MAAEVPAHNPVRVLIVDDRAAVRRDLKILLELVEGVQVVGGAASADCAVALAHRLDPDIIVLDLALRNAAGPPQVEAELDGLEIIPHIKKHLPSSSVFVLTVHDYPLASQASFQAGADGFFVKGRDLDALLGRVRELCSQPS